MYRALLLFFVLIVNVAFGTEHKESTVLTTTIDFYSEQLPIPYKAEMVIDCPDYVVPRQMTNYFHRMESVPYQSLFNYLLEQKEQLELNDWLFYELLKQSVDFIYADKNELQRTLTCWFFLSKAGYDTKITYRENNAFLHVYSQYNIYEMPMIQIGGKNYYNLTCYKKDYQAGGVLNLLEFFPNPNGNSFSFDLATFPRLKPNLFTRELSFSWRDHQFDLTVTVDQTIGQIMKDYPVIDEFKYLEVPFSSTLYHSLLPQMEQILEGKSTQQALEILAAFTRSAFNYKEDHENFGQSKPMIADEVLQYEFSDCEDRAALYYALVQQLLDLPMLVIAYPDHLSIAVSVDQSIGDPIDYNGRKYYICDPTGPANSVAIGTAPAEYKDQPFEIIGTHQ